MSVLPRARAAAGRALLAWLAGALVLLAALAPPAGARVLDIQEVTSPEGQVFWLVEAPEIPIVALEISFAGGARLDPDGKAGLASLVAALMDEGAGERDALAFATRRDELAARFSFEASPDSLRVGARMLTETLEESAALLASALAAPRFDPETIARVRGQRLAEIAESANDPTTVSRRAWYARAFPDHSYGTPTEGTAESVEAIARDDLAAQHRRLLTRATARIGVVGDLDAAAAGALVDTLLAGLDQGTPRRAEPRQVTPPPGVEVVPLPVPQSAAMFGHAGIRRDDPDFIAAYVMNYVLGGGGLTSRLMEEVRDKRGLAYGVFSTFSIRDESALYVGAVQTANARMAESLEVIRAEWARMREEGVTEDELERAKRYLTGAFPLQLDSNAKIANMLVFLQEEDLGIDYVDRRGALIEAVTPDDVARVAKRLLKPEALSVVVAGQPEGL